MDSARRGQFDTPEFPAAEARGRRVVVRAKRASKRLVSFVPGIECNLCDRPVGVAELPGRTLEAQPSQQLDRCLADHSAKHAVKMERRQARAGGKVLEIERLVELSGDLLDHALRRFLVERPRFRLHTNNLSACRTECLISLAIRPMPGDAPASRSRRGISAVWR